MVSPRDALLEPARGRRVRVGGRVLRQGAALLLADAFGALRIELEGSRPAHAALAIFEGELEGGVLTNARLIEEIANPTGVLPPEFERLFQAGVGRELLLRGRAFEAVRRFFVTEGFLEVDTPLRSAECSTEPHIEPLICSGGYLITSPELHMKRLLVAGVPKLFQVVHCFRAEELGAWHSPEFTLLEWYRAFASYDVVLSDTERLLHYLCRELRGHASIELPGGALIDLTPPFSRLRVSDAFLQYAGVGDVSELAARNEDAYFQLLVDKVEPALAQYPKPVFLFDYPATQAALARRVPGDPRFAERFELYLAGVELCNGYGELTDPAEQRARCELERQQRQARGRSVPAIPSRFLEALEHGMPPASGNAVGLDRVIALLAGRDRIDAVRPFPDALA